MPVFSYKLAKVRYWVDADDWLAADARAVDVAHAYGISVDQLVRLYYVDNLTEVGTLPDIDMTDPIDRFIFTNQ